MKQYNKRLKITASAIGILLGLSGALNHGVFEILQGNVSTNGFFIEAISEIHRFWLHGTEAAFTLVHNYLFTGISAVLVGISLIIWSIQYLHVKQGSTMFISLLLLLTLVGGGIGYILLFLPTWAFATQINKSLDWWEKLFSEKMRKALSVLWIPGLIATLILWIMVMQMGIFGYFPGQNDPDVILNIVFVFLFAAVFLACLTFIFAIAGDIKRDDIDLYQKRMANG